MRIVYGIYYHAKVRNTIHSVVSDFFVSYKICLTPIK